jgi:hypothetical protein
MRRRRPPVEPPPEPASGTTARAALPPRRSSASGDKVAPTEATLPMGTRALPPYPQPHCQVTAAHDERSTGCPPAERGDRRTARSWSRRGRLTTTCRRSWRSWTSAAATTLDRRPSPWGSPRAETRTSARPRPARRRCVDVAADRDGLPSALTNAPPWPIQAVPGPSAPFVAGDEAIQTGRRAPAEPPCFRPRGTCDDHT